MEPEKFKTSALIQRLMKQKFPKLDPSSLNGIIVKARKMSKYVSPQGCSQNLKAEFQDPDKALEYSRRKNIIFQDYLNHEMSKLNFSACSSGNMEKKRPTVKSCIPSYVKFPIKATSVTQSPQLPKSHTKKKGLYSKLTSKQRFSSFDGSVKALNTKESILLPPLIKSTPQYLDPFYGFPKKNSEDSARREIIKHQRVSSLDSVSQQCDELLPICKNNIEDIIKVQNEKKDEKLRVNEYMEDFSECLKLAHDQKSFEDSLSTRFYNRKLDKEFLNDIDKLKEGLMNVTKSAIDYGGQKIWRWKNTLFLANADKLINSVPSMRK